MIEVAVGVEFVPSSALGAVQLVGLHERWRQDYPQVQEQSALPPGPPPGTVLAPLAFGFFSQNPPLRLWMLAPDGRTLLQAQYDRLILNWRRLDRDTDEYPRYRTLRPEFLSRWADFVAYLKEVGAPGIRPAVAEVTFVNSIHSPGGRKDLSAVLSTVAQSQLGGDLLESRIQQVVDVSRPSAPAHMLLFAGPDETRQSDVTLTVTTRVSLHEEADDLDAIGEALDHAHDTGVRGFSDVTNPSMHDAWGRIT